MLVYRSCAVGALPSGVVMMGSLGGSTLVLGVVVPDVALWTSGVWPWVGLAVGLATVDLGAKDVTE